MGLRWAGLEGRPYASCNLPNAFEHRPRRIIRRREPFKHGERAVFYVNAVCKRAPGINRDAHGLWFRALSQQAKILPAERHKVVIGHDAIFDPCLPAWSDEIVTNIHLPRLECYRLFPDSNPK